MTNSNNYLVHYGVLGMKWGVRKKKLSSGVKRSKKSNNSKSLRDKDYKYLKNQRDFYNKRSNNLSSAIRDLEKNKSKSKEIEKAHGKFTNKDFEQIVGITKKQAASNLLTEYKSDLKDSQKSTKQYNEMMKALKNTPSNKKTFMDKKRKREKISKGIGAVGTILGLSGSVALGVATKSPSVAIATAVTTGMLGMFGVDSINPTNDRYIYEKYVNKKK